MRKLSRAESGKLGGEKSKIISSLKKEIRKDAYAVSPNSCKHCGVVLDYDSRNKTFCSRSCSVTFNNLKKASNVKWNCMGCGSEHSSLPHKVKKFCGHTCQRLVTKAETFTRLLNGQVSDRLTIKRQLIDKHGRKCFECGLSEWRDQPIPIEVDHINGNAGDNSYENLRLLCPNCHGLTPTWKGRNKGNGRASRGLPLS